jgi:hypothetical protein
MPLFPPQDYRNTANIHRRGLAANRPAAADVLPGTLYFSTDTLALERSDGTVWATYSPSGSAGAQGAMGPMGPEGESYEDYSLIPGPTGNQGPPGTAGTSLILVGPQGLDGEDLEPFLVPGTQGPQGVQGIQGIQGPPGFALDGEDIEPFIIPGPKGDTGSAGSIGATGPAGVSGFAFDGEDGQDGFPIVGPTGPAGSGGAGNTGTATLDFGAFPGASDASVAVTGQASIVAGSIVQAWLRPEDTADHLADEHMVETINIFAGNIVDGTGFTIYGFNYSQMNEPVVPALFSETTFVQNAATTGIGKAIQFGKEGQLNLGGGKGTRIYGTWKVAWRWS